MASAPLPSSRASASLHLDDIHTVLAQTIAAAEERARILAAKAPEDEALPDPDPSGGHLAGQLEACLRDFHHCTERAGHAAEEADAVLGDSEATLRRWLGEAAALRQRLAEWVARAV